MHYTPEQAAFYAICAQAEAQLKQAASELHKAAPGLSEEIFNKKNGFLKNIVAVIRSAHAAVEAGKRETARLKRIIKEMEENSPVDDNNNKEGYLSHLRYDREQFRAAHSYNQRKKYNW